jgi:hypothetical protein
VAESREITLRYPGVCAECETPLPKGTPAWWDKDTRTVRCQACGPIQTRTVSPGEAPPTPPDPVSGIAGGSARHEYERRHNKREERIREEHPRIGKLLLALSSDPKSTTAWERGGAGEEILGKRLDTCASESVIVLHDLRVPGKSSNIDHIVVTPGRVFVIDAKRYGGEIRKRDYGGLFRSDVRLTVKGRDRSSLVKASLAQAALVADALPGRPDDPEVVPVLCFLHGEWPLFARPFEIDGVVVIWPRALASLLRSDQEGQEAEALDLARTISERFRPAS